MTSKLALQRAHLLLRPSPFLSSKASSLPLLTSSTINRLPRYPTQHRLYASSASPSTPPPLPTDPVYPPPSVPPATPTPTAATQPKARSLARKLLRLTFFTNLVFFGVLALGGGGLYLYYSWIAPAKVVYTRGRDGIKYAVGVYGTGKEWYDWGAGMWKSGPGAGSGEEAVVVKEQEKKKGWLW